MFSKDFVITEMELQSGYNSCKQAQVSLILSVMQSAPTSTFPFFHEKCTSGKGNGGNIISANIKTTGHFSLNQDYAPKDKKN